MGISASVIRGEEATKQKKKRKKKHNKIDEQE
jgi:hypothetical protein